MVNIENWDQTWREGWQVVQRDSEGNIISVQGGSGSAPDRPAMQERTAKQLAKTDNDSYLNSQNTFGVESIGRVPFTSDDFDIG